MSRDTDRLIEQLALEAVPVRPLASPMQRTVGWLAASMAVVAVLAVLLGWRGGMPTGRTSSPVSCGRAAC